MKLRDIFEGLSELELKKIAGWYGAAVLGTLFVVFISLLIIFLVLYVPWYIGVPMILFISALAAVIYAVD